MDDYSRKNYEIAFLVKDETHVPAVLSLLKQHGADIIYEGPVQNMQAAYPIEKEITVIFGYVHFSLVPGKIRALEKDLTVSSAVLRHLIITPPFVKVARGPMTGSATRPTKQAQSEPSRETVAVAPKSTAPLSNEELEKKIDEILQ